MEKIKHKRIRLKGQNKILDEVFCATRIPPNKFLEFGAIVDRGMFHSKLFFLSLTTNILQLVDVADDIHTYIYTDRQTIHIYIVIHQYIHTYILKYIHT